jgi:hypothetical protein
MHFGCSWSSTTMRVSAFLSFMRRCSLPCGYVTVWRIPGYIRCETGKQKPLRNAHKENPTESMTELKSAGVPSVILYTRRWYIFLLYCLNSFMMSGEFCLYNSTPATTQEYYKEAKITMADINLCLSLCLLPRFLLFFYTLTLIIRSKPLFCLLCSCDHVHRCEVL